MRVFAFVLSYVILVCMLLSYVQDFGQHSSITTCNIPRVLGVTSTSSFPVLAGVYSGRDVTSSSVVMKIDDISMIFVGLTTQTGVNMISAVSFNNFVIQVE